MASHNTNDRKGESSFQGFRDELQEACDGFQQVDKIVKYQTCAKSRDRVSSCEEDSFSPREEQVQRDQLGGQARPASGNRRVLTRLPKGTSTRPASGRCGSSTCSNRKTTARPASGVGVLFQPMRGQYQDHHKGG